MMGGGGPDFGRRAAHRHAGTGHTEGAQVVVVVADGEYIFGLPAVARDNLLQCGTFVSAGRHGFEEKRGGAHHIGALADRLFHLLIGRTGCGEREHLDRLGHVLCAKLGTTSAVPRHT
ncbi:hypothetical protein HC891_05085, partial [Candidatus Gracilibacteria bacterium]|nr:hypothetical protein [Candidatus Gracilibacteria bacterium]